MERKTLSDTERWERSHKYEQTIKSCSVKFSDDREEEMDLGEPHHAKNRQQMDKKRKRVATNNLLGNPRQADNQVER